MTNTAEQTMTLITDDEVRSMKRDELRKYASKLGLKGVNKLTRGGLNDAVTRELNERRPKTVTRIRTSHAECNHVSTKAARAKCRRERAAQK